MDRERLAKSLSGLTICFVGCWVGLAVLIAINSVVPDWETNSALSIVAGLAALAAVVLSIGFYWNLGILASSLNKSWITWVGLSFIFKPFGGIFAYFAMRSHVRTALAGLPPAPTPVLRRS